MRQLGLAFDSALTQMNWEFSGDESAERSGDSTAYADSPWWWQRHHFGNADALMQGPSARRLTKASGPGTADWAWRVEPLASSKRTEPYSGGYAQNSYVVPRRDTYNITRGGVAMSSTCHPTFRLPPTATNAPTRFYGAAIR